MFRAALACLALLALPVQAQEPVAPGDLVSIEVLPGWQTGRGTVMAGLRLRLAPGWKTYWRAPGEAGIPPQFFWTGSDNLRAAGFHWPVPEVFETSGLRSIGYHDEVVIPLELTPADASAPVHLAGEVDLGVCDDICVPVSLDFAADLDVGDRRDPALVAALVDQPATAAEAGVTGVACTFAPEAQGMRVTAVLDLPRAGADEVVVIEAGDAGLWVSPAQSVRAGGRLTASAMVVPTGNAPVALDRARMRLTVIGDGRAVDIRGCPAGG
ncbi:MAG: hypothetical protein H3C51_03055 [Rubellimicrobium sp.]|nr:hypothetical protein [Rubellimicrobium sp.]